jgi:hypothetical protein
VYHELGKEVRREGAGLLDVDDLLEMLTVSSSGLPESLEDKDDSGDLCFPAPEDVLVVTSLLRTGNSSLSEISMREVEVLKYDALNTILNRRLVRK